VTLHKQGRRRHADLTYTWPPRQASECMRVLLRDSVTPNAAVLSADSVESSVETFTICKWQLASVFTESCNGLHI
jgi:hypothetical protein